MSTSGIEAVQNGMGDALRNMLANGRFLNNSGLLRSAVDLYKRTEEARSQSPQKVEAMVLDKIAYKLLQVTHLDFLQLVFDRGIHEAQKARGKGRGPNDFPDVRVNFPPFNPNVYFVVFVGEVRLKSEALKISFELDPSVFFQGIRWRSDGNGGSLSVKSIVGTLGLYLLAKMMIGRKRRKIGEKSFSVDGFELTQKELKAYRARLS